MVVRRLAGSRSIRRMMVALLAAGGLMFVAPAMPASASPTCHGFTCHGHDPNVYGCVVSSQKFAYYYSGSRLMVTLTNKYSIKCNANWAQAQLSPYAVSLGWNFKVEIAGSDSANPQNFEEMCWYGPGSPDNTASLNECPPSNPPYSDSISIPAWTDMIDGTNVTEALIDVYDSYGTPLFAMVVDQ